MNGKLHMQAVAGIFVVVGVIGVLAQVALLLLRQPPAVVSAISSVACVIGAYYFLKGSWLAKIFLVAMAALSTLLGGAAGIALLARPSVPIGLFTLLLAAATGYCLYVLLLSKSLKAEFDHRSRGPGRTRPRLLSAIMTNWSKARAASDANHVPLISRQP